MSLRSQLAVYQDENSSADLATSIEIGPQILELRVNRKDHNAATERELWFRRHSIAAELGVPAESEEEIGAMLLNMELYAERVAKLISAYRIYSKDATPEEIE